VPFGRLAEVLVLSERADIDVLHRFNEEGIKWAFPTQTVHVASGAASLS
jgi:hypothetical protein